MTAMLKLLGFRREPMKWADPIDEAIFCLRGIRDAAMEARHDLDMRLKVLNEQMIDLQTSIDEVTLIRARRANDVRQLTGAIHGLGGME